MIEFCCLVILIVIIIFIALLFMPKQRVDRDSHNINKDSEKVDGKICIKCGNVSPLGSRYCNNCGNEF